MKRVIFEAVSGSAVWGIYETTDGFCVCTPSTSKNFKTESGATRYAKKIGVFDRGISQKN